MPKVDRWGTFYYVFEKNIDTGNEGIWTALNVLAHAAERELFSEKLKEQYKDYRIRLEILRLCHDMKKFSGADFPGTADTKARLETLVASHPESASAIFFDALERNHPSFAKTLLDY